MELRPIDRLNRPAKEKKKRAPVVRRPSLEPCPVISPAIRQTAFRFSAELLPRFGSVWTS
jgi:hypothetical protein